MIVKSNVDKHRKNTNIYKFKKKRIFREQGAQGMKGELILLFALTNNNNKYLYFSMQMYLGQKKEH